MIKQIKEGKADLIVPETDKLSKKNPFCNPFMKINRDFTVCAVKVLKPASFVDGLSACGALAVRIAKETESKVTACEINSDAFGFLRKNAELNSAEIKTVNSDLNLFIVQAEEAPDFIDIDPFGSPARFLDNVLMNAKHNEIMGVTATDTAPLCGTYPRTCERKYMAVSMKTDFYNESGLRILIGYIARTAAKYSFGVEILFSYALQHYFKVYLKVNKSRKYADLSLRKVKFIQYCECLNRRYSGIDELDEFCGCGKKFKNFGLMWSGEFADIEFCSLLEKEVGDNSEKKILELVKEEQSITIPYYEVHKICKKYGLKIPSMKKIIEKDSKIKRTHFSGMGVRFCGSITELKEILSE